MSLPGWALDRPEAPSRCRAARWEPVPRRTFDVIDLVEILTHWCAGRSQHGLAASLDLGVDRKTQRKYTAPAVAAGFDPGGPPMRGGLAHAGVSGSRSWPIPGCGRCRGRASSRTVTTFMTSSSRG